MDIFEVEKILKKVERNGVNLFLVKWMEYGNGENTYEPLENLDGCPEALEDFEKNRIESIYGK